MKKNPIILIDMDSITVDMTPKWLKIYYERTGERLKVTNQTDWAFGKLAKYPTELNRIYEEDGFFADLKPMPESTKYIPKLIDKGVDVLFLTQLPRKSDFAARDKKIWIEKNIPGFNMRNVIFSHRKYLVHGDVFFDDNPIHLQMWKNQHPTGFTATIQYPYNKSCEYVDWNFKVKSRAWKDFYQKVCDYYDL